MLIKSQTHVRDLVSYFDQSVQQEGHPSMRFSSLVKILWYSYFYHVIFFPCTFLHSSLYHSVQRNVVNLSMYEGYGPERDTGSNKNSIQKLQIGGWDITMVKHSLCH